MGFFKLKCLAMTSIIVTFGLGSVRASAVSSQHTAAAKVVSNSQKVLINFSEMLPAEADVGTFSKPGTLFLMLGGPLLADGKATAIHFSPKARVIVAGMYIDVQPMANNFAALFGGGKLDSIVLGGFYIVPDVNLKALNFTAENVTLNNVYLTAKQASALEPMLSQTTSVKIGLSVGAPVLDTVAKAMTKNANLKTLSFRIDSINDKNIAAIKSIFNSVNTSKIENLSFIIRSEAAKAIIANAVLYKALALLNK